MRNLLLFMYYLVIAPWPRQLGGAKLRNLFGAFLLDKMGIGSQIKENVHFGKGRGLSLGENSYLGRNCFLALDSSIIIGKNVMIGPQVMIFTANHGLSSETPMIFQPTQKAPVLIEDDVFVGARAIIMPGVCLGHGCVVGAGSVVTKSVDPYCIVGGVPARYIRSRRVL